MIQGIEIERFRCFQHSNFEGFKQINLIGGQNNSGKTSLLEAIMIALTGNLDHADYFGWERVKNRNEIVNGVPSEGTFSLSAFFAQHGSEGKKETLEFSLKNGGITHPRQGYFIKMPAVISSKTRTEASRLAEKLDIATRSGEEAKWLQGMKCIDPTVEIIRTFTIDGSHRIYVKKKGQKEYHNLSQMGDAVFKALEILAHTSQNQDGYLLIDEIENGIHFSHHEEFWKMVFRLCVEFNVQVFATSHSLEMIKAFNAVAGTEGFGGISQYMEMFRSARTGEIVANTFSHETLTYSIENQLSFRGE